MKLCPETFPMIQAHEPNTADAILKTCTPINLKNCNGVLIIVMQLYAADTDLTITVDEGATAAEATAGTYPLTTGAEFPIWLNTDTATSDALVRQTDAVTVTINTGAHKNQIAALYVPTSVLTAGRYWIIPECSAGNIANYASILYILDGERYQQETPPTAIA
jgi:hypothetical protein